MRCWTRQFITMARMRGRPCAATSGRSCDKRANMYDGTGTVYLLQMFEEGELVNNRIGAYMVLLTEQDSVGFHTHGNRGEQNV